MNSKFFDPQQNNDKIYKIFHYLKNIIIEKYGKIKVKKIERSRNIEY
jgi:hypothetical protein